MFRRRILLKDNSTIDISDKAIITCSSKTYNGQTQIATDITVTVNESVLIEDVDYVITQNDGGINAGQYSIIISGINKYCGTKQGQFTIVKVTPTVTIPTPRTSITYNGSEQALINAGSTDFGTLKYSLDDSTYSTTIPSGTNATSYTVYYKVEGDSNINDVAAQSISVTIAKASTTYTAPTAKSLTYNSSSQALLNAGAVTGGTIYYSSDNTNWSTTIPTGSNAGSYTSYWKITGDSNHTDKASASISTTISKATGSVSFGTSSVTAYTIQSTYQQTASKNGTSSLTYSSNNTSVATVNSSSGLVTLKSAGTVRITASMAASANYTSASTYYTITVQTLASPTTFNVTLSSWELYNSDSTYRYYRSTNHTHSSSGTTTLTAISSGSITLDVRSYAESSYDYVVVKKGSTILVSTSGNQSASVYTRVYSNVSAGDVISVIYRKDGSVDKDDDTGYLKIATSYLPTPSYTAPTAKSLTYNGSAQVLLNSGSATGGTIQYSSDNSNWSTTIPSGTNATSYTSYWRIVGDNVHNDKASTSISTTINKANQNAPTATGATVDEGNTAIATASGGGGQGSIEWSNGNTRTAVGSQTTRARWGGNSNYNASAWSNEVTLEVEPILCTLTLKNGSTVKIKGTGTLNSNDISGYSGDIKAAIISSSCTEIGGIAFFDCSGLTSVTIPSSVTSIGFAAFQDCSGLTTVTIPNSVITIEPQTFSYCKSLTSVTIGNSVTSISGSAFSYCSGLKSVTIPNSVTSIGGSAFSNCTSLTSCTIGSGVTSIGNSAFQYCSKLTAVTIPNSVTSIGSGVFYYCTKLTSVTIGNSVTSIGNQAFYNCSSLTNITSNAVTAPAIGSTTFQNVKTGGTLRVPQGSSGYNVWMGTGNYYLGKYNWNMLPQGYTILEYIENNSSAYIDTQCTLDFTETIKIKMSVSDYRGQWGGIFGNYSNEDSNCTRIIQNNNNPSSAYVYFNNKAGGGGKVITINGLNQINSYEISSSAIIVNSTNAGTPSTVSGNAYNAPIKLFRYSDTSVYGKLYPFSISGKRNMIPCINSNGVVGMYDTIGQRFYSSANSSTFVAGPIIG